MLRKLRERIQSEERGFTLIELLVVILIIGILAAIAIPAFLSQTDKADDASAKSAARNAQTAAETYNVDEGGSYVGMDGEPNPLLAIEPTLNDNVPDVTEAAEGTYSLTVTADTGNTYTVARQANGTVVRSCVVEAGNENDGGCNDGVW